MPIRLTKDDKESMAEKICDTKQTRADKRKPLERQWREIDRQLAMIPAEKVKKQQQGQIEQLNAWMSETELPNQSETLEISTADARRLMVPKGVDWLTPH